jgi:uncharacterized membrane protein
MRIFPLIQSRPRGMLEAMAPDGVGRALGRRTGRAVQTAYHWLRPRPTGVTFGTLFFCTSLTPSLLPRPWLAQGLISGVALALGYGIGSAAGRLGGLAHRVPPLERRLLAVRKRVSFRPAGWTLATSLALLVLTAVYLGSSWQHDLYALMGEPTPPRATYLRVPAIALLVLAGAVALVRTVRDAGHLVVRLLHRWIPPGPLQVAGTTVTLVVIAIAAEEIALGSFYTVAGRVYAAANAAVLADGAAPAEPTRSAGPGSLVSWHSLGAEGRSFVSGGPTQEELRTFADATGLDSGEIRQPIRVYVGLQASADPKAAATLAVAELDRTKAFDRSVLCVVTTTGTGWVDPYLTAALEYLYRGDTAIVGVQYSYLPSWISFLSEQDRVAQTGPELFNQVHARWSQLPVGHRPRLLVFA